MLFLEHWIGITDAVTCLCCRPVEHRSTCNSRSSSGSQPQPPLCHSLHNPDCSASLAVRESVKDWEWHKLQCMSSSYASTGLSVVHSKTLYTVCSAVDPTKSLQSTNPVQLHEICLYFIDMYELVFSMWFSKYSRCRCMFCGHLLNTQTTN